MDAVVYIYEFLNIKCLLSTSIINTELTRYLVSDQFFRLLCASKLFCDIAVLKESCYKFLY